MVYALQIDTFFMLRTRGFQIVALQNLDRLLLKSMLGMLERHLNAKWFESALAPTVVFADSDHAEGFQALDSAKKRGICTVAISNRSSSSWHFTLRRPIQTRDLMTILNQIDGDQALAAQTHRATSQNLAASAGRGTISQLAPRNSTPVPSDTALLRKAGNLYQYLSARGPRTIVDVRFAPGRSLMFNHTLGEYCSAISQPQLVQLAVQSVQETAHGEGQANAEWTIAKRMLPARSIEDLTWQITLAHSAGVALPGVSDAGYLMSRLPRLSVSMPPAQLSMAKLLMRTPTTPTNLARSVGVPLTAAIDFCNAAFACGLLQNPTSPILNFSALLSSAALVAR
jgi:hypothetical protein